MGVRLVSLVVLLFVSIVLPGSVSAGELLRLKAGGVLRSSEMPDIARALTSASSEALFLVQWKGPIHEEEKDALEKLGLEHLSYVPDDAFLVRGSGQAALEAQKLDFIHAVVAYERAFKLEPELTRHGVFSFSDKVDVSLQLAPGADLGEWSRLVDIQARPGSGVVLAKSSLGALWKLAGRPDLLWVERSLPLRLAALDSRELGASGISAATETGFESGVKILNVDAMYARGITGEGQIVAVADTGLDTGDASTLTADFQGQLAKGLAMGVGGKSWGDPMMHGTHVSGSILGNGRASNNLIRGGAYSAKLVMEGMWSDIMNNIVPPSIPKLFDAAYAEGARIHSNSWGAPGSNGRYDNWCVLTDTWLFQHPDYLALFASGNEGEDRNRDGVIDEGSVSSPGTSKNVLTVGASKNYLLEGGIQRMMKELRGGTEKWGIEPIASSRLSDDMKGMAAFSSRGPTSDGRLKPELVGPGTNIVSVRDTHPKADPASMSWGIYNAHYVYMGGTSMSTPVVAGGMALLRQFLQQKLGTQAVSAALLKAAAGNSAEDLFPGQFGSRPAGQEQPTRRPNNHEGWGRMNLAQLDGARSVQYLDETEGLSTGQEKTWAVTVPAGSSLRVTLAYTDAPGTAGAQRVLVNDLDLLVKDASGRSFFPNGRGTRDSVNNMEEVDVLGSPGGGYTVSVRAANVPQGKNGRQPYGLVISTGP